MVSVLVGTQVLILSWFYLGFVSVFSQSFLGLSISWDSSYRLSSLKPWSHLGLVSVLSRSQYWLRLKFQTVETSTLTLNWQIYLRPRSLIRWCLPVLILSGFWRKPWRGNPCACPNSPENNSERKERKDFVEKEDLRESLLIQGHLHVLERLLRCFLNGHLLLLF